MISIPTPIPTLQRIMARLRAGEDQKQVARDEEISLKQLKQELRAACPEYARLYPQTDQPAQPRRKSTRGRIRNKQLEKAMHAERENLLKGVPEDQRWKLVGRTMEDFQAEELERLRLKVEHWQDTGSGRVMMTDDRTLIEVDEEV